MKTWVVKTGSSDGLSEEETTVRAESFSVLNGTLCFWNGEEDQRAIFSPKHWISAEVVEEGSSV